MESKGFLKNLTSTACALSIAFSFNASSTILVEGNMKPAIEKNHDSYSAVTPVLQFEGKTDNYYIKRSFSKIETEAKNIFGIMRDATEEEQQAVGRYISSISKDTGVNFFDIC